MPNDAPVFDEDFLSALDDDPTELSAEEFDTDADYAAPPPPLPDGWHEAKLHLIGAKDSQGVLKEAVGPRPWGNIPSTYFTQIDASVVDPGGAQDGKRTNRYNVTTHGDPRQNNASAASLVYRAIKDAPLPGLKPAMHIKAVLDELRGEEPVVWIKTQLEGEPAEASRAYQDAKKAGTLPPGAKKPKTYRGEKNFMENGKVTGRTFDAASGETVVARPTIVDMKPQSFVPPSR